MGEGRCPLLWFGVAPVAVSGTLVRRRPCRIRGTSRVQLRNLGGVTSWPRDRSYSHATLVLETTRVADNHPELRNIVGFMVLTTGRQGHMIA
ncbi:hypothetical protein NDU88_001543 [Pleurodeles waltl]|uniref:Secreted protein n=1 Tax=Pleurodeles waltl TaxID=8319 RepID=A0AAV7LYX5_PLEWA|nr:hypothetical protein NDU88_001543 [Pleurodeles waltl]